MKNKPIKFSHRQQQILLVLADMKEATLSEIHDRMQDDPGRQAVHTFLNYLIKKGAVRRNVERGCYTYSSKLSKVKILQYSVDTIVKDFNVPNPSELVKKVFTFGFVDRSDLEGILKRRKQRKQRG